MADRCAALARVPAYVAATPEKRYRKNPLTWLNGRCWEDEDLPAPRSGPTEAAPPPPVAPPPAEELNHDFLAEQQAKADAALTARLGRYATAQTTQPTRTAAAA